MLWTLRLAIILALVCTSAAVVEFSPPDVFRWRVHRSNTEEVSVRHVWQFEREQASIQSLDSKLLVPGNAALVTSKLGVTPAEGVAGALGTILVLLVLAAVGLRAAAQASRESEERFAKIFRSSPLAITISTQKEGRYLDVNEAFLQMLRYERKEIIGHSSLDLNVWVDPDDRARMLQLKDSTVSKILPTRMRTSRGETRQVNVSAELIELDGVSCVLAITQDVTETQRLEDQFRQAHKMEALGRLATGIGGRGNRWHEGTHSPDWRAFGSHQRSPRYHGDGGGAGGGA